MKKMVLSAVFLFAAFTSVMAFTGDDRPVTFEQLPEKAQQFIKQHFGDRKISYAKQDTDWFDGDYEVRFVDGDKVAFRRNGDWEEVECKGTQVPAAIVPQAISGYVAKQHPDERIIEIERDARGYEIKLSNRIEIKFDKKGNLFRYDR